MLHFESDYLEGAHPLILKRLIDTNLEQTPGYGTDHYCEQAKRKIQAACGCPDAQVFFLTGGTQTNATVIDALLANYEGVVAADTGHVSVHEAGAIEAGGHKVLTIPHIDGKLDPAPLKRYLAAQTADRNRDHMVIPGMVYISHPTEYGTLYTTAELESLSAICREYGIPLFCDGARLGYGLAASGTDVTLEAVARNCDAFYIGGTKIGALFGEAVVFTGPDTAPHFFTTVKQHGALLAKGRLLGLQFEALFTDGLYLEISRHAIAMAEKLVAILEEKGYRFFLKTPTNQQFIILENGKMAELETQVGFSYWEPLDEGHTVVRFATSWATTAESLEELRKIL